MAGGEVSELIHNPLEDMAEKAQALREKLGRKLTAAEALELLEEALENPEIMIVE